MTWLSECPLASRMLSRQSGLTSDFPLDTGLSIRLSLPPNMVAEILTYTSSRLCNDFHNLQLLLFQPTFCSGQFRQSAGLSSIACKIAKFWKTDDTESGTLRSRSEQLRRAQYRLQGRELLAQSVRPLARRSDGAIRKSEPIPAQALFTLP